MFSAARLTGRWNRNVTDWRASFNGPLNIRLPRPNERFTGIHVDIEPHVLAEWKTNQASVVKQWQASVRYLVHEAHTLNLPIGSDMTFWRTAISAGPVDVDQSVDDPAVRPGRHYGLS